MPLGSFITSGLKQTVSELPEDFATKAESIPNILAKQGVKPEELQFSGVTEKLEGRVTKDDLVKAEAGRQDKFDVQTVEPTFGKATIGSEGLDNPTYRENVYTFTGSGEASVSQHFPEQQDYLFHTRTYTQALEGRSSHIVTELQSDVHQQARVEGKQAIAPLEKTWAKKALEREVAAAAEQGLSQVAVPISDLTNSTYKQVMLPQQRNRVEKLIGVEAKGEDKEFLTKLMTDLGGDASTYSSKQLADAVIEQADIAEETVNVTTGIAELKRTQGVQQWYESNVANTAKKIAKSQGLGYETKTIDGINYSIIKLDGKQPKFTLYSSPIVGGFAVYEALKLGASDKQIEDSMLRNGYDAEDVEEMFITGRQIQTAIVAGATEEQVRSFLQAREPELVAEDSEATAPVDNYFTQSEQEYNARLASVANEPWVDLQQGYAKSKAIKALTETELQASAIIANLQVLQPTMASVTTRLSGFFGDKGDARIAEEANKASIKQILNAAKKEGIDLTFKGGEYYLQSAQGEQLVTPDVWSALWREKGEAAGSIVGGVAGFKVGLKAPGGPIVKGMSALGMSTLGAAIGAATGTTSDYLMAAMEMSADLDAQVLAHKALTAAETSAIADLALGSGTLTGKAVWRATTEAKKFLLSGNPQGAKRALEESMFITPEESASILSTLQRVSDVPGKLSEERTIAAVALTKPGLEGLAQAASSLDAKTSIAIAKSISDRATDVLETSNKLADADIASTVMHDLNNYTTDVKDFYNRVKEVPAKSPLANNFSFDYDKLALEPVFDRLGKNITDPRVLEQFALQAQKIRSMSSSRTLTDLLELRQLVNNFKFNKRISSTKDFNMLNDVLTNIDSDIVRGAKETIPNSADWLASYGQAKSKYAEMKTVEKNVLFKALTRPGINTDTAVRNLGRYITAVDGTFSDVLQKLPKSTKAKVEGSVINALTDKFSIGELGGMRAIHFPKLASELDKVSLTTPEARKYKGAIKELALVFKNDIPLSLSTGRIQIKPFQSFLTADPKVRAQFALASSLFNQVRKFKPTAEGRRVSLVLKTAEVLENPLNTKKVKDLMEEAGTDMDLTGLMQDYMSEYAKADTPSAARLILYGDGKLLSTSGKGEKTTIAVDKIASNEIQQRVAEAEGINRANKDALDHALKVRGYLAAQVGTEKVRRFK